MLERLDESNFMLFAAKYYDNPSCYDVVEFYEDLNRFKYLKKLFSRYLETGDLKERLILNHLTTIYNVFGAEAATRILFLKLDEHLSLLKPFLVLLNFMPDRVVGIGITNKTYHASDIPMDAGIVARLRSI